MSLVRTAFFEKDNRYLDNFELWIKDTSPNMVLYKSGDIPILLTVPHGGTSSICSLPKRNPNPFLKDFATETDVYTIEVALSIETYIHQVTGKRPYLVINLLDRKYLDVNRTPEEAYQHPLAKEVYELYHRQIRAAIRSITLTFQHGLLIDIHGQCTESGDIYFGDCNGLTIQTMTEQFGTNVLHDNYGLIRLLLQKGYDVYPRPEKPTPANISGGYTVKTYGSHNVDGIDAEQIEIHLRIRNDANKRYQFVCDFSECLLLFFNQYYVNYKQDLDNIPKTFSIC
ncbi:MAG: N-formylglutamate amidohydrolase [bacterium]|nr:N-formylglutamate amidohydrolase [bacterium]